MNIQNLGWLTLAAGLALLWLGLRRSRQDRRFTGGLSALTAIGIMTLGGALIGLSATFHVYERLAREQAVGSIRFSALDDGAYLAHLSLSDEQATREFRLTGDEWQLDVRFLKWTGPATLLGLDSLYQLDRLSGRYRDPADQRSGEITAYGLTREAAGLAWRGAKEAERWIPWIDAVYGSATFLPMADGASYSIAVTHSGVLARPSNGVAEEALESW